MKTLIVNLFLFAFVLSKAQTFTHSLSISSKQNGLQALAISTDLKNVANTSFNDVRIYDANKNEVPYFLVNESFNYSSTNFKEYKITDKLIDNKRYTSFIVCNPNKETMQNIVLCVANSDALKICNIVGSDDKKQWFSISDGIFLYNLFDESSVKAYRTLSFPLVNYKYIKIEINDLHTLPLNILKAGYFEGAISAGKLNEVKPITYNYSTNGANKKSTVQIAFKNTSIINRISFKITSPNFYKRKAAIYVNRTRTVKHKEEAYKELITEFELNSETTNSFNLNNFREKDFEIEISNADNPALEIESIKAEQLQTYLVADFKANQAYTLFAGNKKLNVPNYDIEFFKNKISQFLPTLQVSNLITIPVVTEIKAPEEKKLWQEPWFMWLCVGAGAVVLGIFSLKIIKDMKNE
jgi:hypothetical protein